MRPSPASAAAPSDRLAIAAGDGVWDRVRADRSGNVGLAPGSRARLGPGDGSQGPGPFSAAPRSSRSPASGPPDVPRRCFGEKDPGRVVVDEIAGQMVALLFVRPTALVLLAAFLLFRVLDVLKPWPARRLEDLPGGSGIMADDLMAGLYANLILHGLALWRPDWLGLA